MQLQYSQESKTAFHIAESYAKENSNDEISPSHLLKAVLHKDAGLVDVLNQMKKDYFYLLEWADIRIARCPKAIKFSDAYSLSDASVAVVEEADNYRLKFALAELTPVCMLISLCTPGVGFSYEQLKTLPLTADELMAFINENVVAGVVRQGSGPQAVSNVPGSKATNIQKHCFDKLLLAQNDLLDPVVGFERDILSIFEILGRKTKSNVLILGDSGVGKTSLVNGLVYRFSGSEVPGILKGARIFEIDNGSLVTGASYKGEIEDRLKHVMEEMKALDKAIVVIESIDQILNRENSLHAVSSVLKQELGKGEVLIVGTSSVEGYTKYIETEKDFDRKFEKLRLQEPDEQKTYRIICDVINRYEDHHHLSVNKLVINQAVKLAKRYLNERHLPDSALDLLDRTLALVNTMNEISASEVALLQQKYDRLRHEVADDDDRERRIDWFIDEIHARISHAMIALVDSGQGDAEKLDYDGKLQRAGDMIDQLSNLSKTRKEEIDEADMLAIVAQLTGIPVGKIQTHERDKLLNAEDHLRQRVVGQDHAIKTIIEAIYESRSGLGKKGQPIGSFFFLGPTGTGKTELAKALAEFLFQDESSMIRFDMSEFKEEHSAALLYGAPPGYVGYEEGGVLVNKIRQKPYSVVLFDEIEKAHASVFDIFLQILDEGKLHDRLGREGDFSNALVLFTSNIGSKHITSAFARNEIPASNDLLDIMTDYFRPEFLGRLTEIIPFAPISEEIVQLIFDIHLKGLHKTLTEMEIALEIEPEARKALANAGFSPQYGARPILGVIRNQIRRPLSKLVIAGSVSKGSKVSIQYRDNDVVWTYSQ